MQYLLLIYAEEEDLPEMGAELVDEYRALNAGLGEVFISAARLHPVATATTQRVRNGEVLTSDGPFAETKEQLAGFYLLECADLDAALGHAARLPAARVGSVEVRPVI